VWFASAVNMGEFAESEQDALEELQHNYLSLRIDDRLADARESGDNCFLMHGDESMPVMRDDLMSVDDKHSQRSTD